MDSSQDEYADVPVKHMLVDKHGEFIGMVLISAEGFTKFIKDNKLEMITLRYIEKDWMFECACRTPISFLVTPHLTEDYKPYFIAVDET